MLWPCLLVGMLSLSVPHPSAASSSQAPASPSTWLTVLDGGKRLHLGQNQWVRFQGQGHLSFGVDRRLVDVETGTPPTVFVNGQATREPRAVAEDDILEIKAEDGSAWVIRLAEVSEVEAVVDATRIRAPHPDGPARLNMDEPTIFYVHIGEAGGSTFVYPQRLP